MPIVRLLLLLIALMVAPVGALAQGNAEGQVADEIAERTQMFDQVAAAAARRDFAALNAMAQDMRVRRVRTPSGTWRLAYFYFGWQASLPREADTGTCGVFDQQFIDDWIAADPQASPPYIAQSIALQRKAWCIRGTGFAATVSPVAMERFVALMVEARAVLEDHRAIASVDPRFHEELIHTAVALGTPRAEFERLLNDAIAQEPYYYGIYFAASQYYLPQWNGEPGDLDRLGRLAVASTPHDGNGSYARLFWHLDQCHCLNLGDVDWELMKTAMQDISGAYPNDWNSANFARLACVAGDGATAKSHMVRIAVDSEQLWPSPSMHRACRALTDRY